MSNSAKDIATPSLNALQAALKTYVEKLHSLIETGGSPRSVRAAVRSILRAHSSARAALVSFKLYVHESWFRRMQEECHARAQELEVCRRVATDKTRPVAQQLCAGAIMALVGAFMVTPGVLYVKVKKELQSDLFDLPRGLAEFRRRERRATAWAIGCSLATLTLAVLGLNPLLSVATFLVGLVFFVIEKLHLPDFSYPGASLPGRLADQLQIALKATQEGIIALDELSHGLLQINPPALPDSLLTVVHQFDRGENPSPELLEDAALLASKLYEQLSGFLQPLLKEGSPNNGVEPTALSFRDKVRRVARFFLRHLFRVPPPN